jgi:hypothetical protein
MGKSGELYAELHPNTDDELLEVLSDAEWETECELEKEKLINQCGDLTGVLKYQEFLNKNK